MHQPVTSSTAAQAIATVPRRLPSMFAFSKDARQHGKGGDAHGRSHEQSEAGEGDAVVGEARIEIKRKKRGQHKRSSDAHVTGQNRGMAFFLQFAWD